MEETSFKGARKVIAARMMHSLQTSAQLTFHAEADITALLQARRLWRAEGRSISLEDCLIHALCQAHKNEGGLSGVAGADHVSLCQDLHLAIAVATKAGLMTPVLRHADSMSLERISTARRELVETALAGKLKVSDMKGGTFTLSNLGQTRVSFFTPILNSGQLALLGVGSYTRRVCLQKENVEERAFLPLSLTADHRVVDGAPAGRFLTLVCEGLEVMGSHAF